MFDMYDLRIVIVTIFCTVQLLGNVILCHEEHEELPKLILISFDGFRWDYIENMNPSDIPNFIKFRNEGVYAREGLKNVFVTNTFPNHYSLVTGLYEESHGVVSNVMYDPLFNETFSYHDLKTTLESKWFGGEPIWVTNQKTKSRRTGVAMWPCSIAPIKDTLPSTYLLYDMKLSQISKINILLSWFTVEQPINLGLMYVHEPDHTGHQFGPNSPQVKDKIKEIDGYFGYLLRKLEAMDLLRTMNIIVTSDHGMSNTPKDKVIYLDHYVNSSLYTFLTGYTTVNIIPKNGYLDQVYNALRKIDHVTVYKKEDIPDEYHYKHNRRITPLIIVADVGYQIVKNKSSWTHVGSHGYNNSQSEMHPFFMARGPAFKENVIIEGFDSVDIYPMMCHILSLSPAPNNGSLNNVMALLKHKEMTNGRNLLIYILVIPLCLFISGALCVATVCQNRASRHHHGASLLLGVSTECDPILPETSGT